MVYQDKLFPMNLEKSNFNISFFKLFQEWKQNTRQSSDAIWRQTKQYLKTHGLYQNDKMNLPVKTWKMPYLFMKNNGLYSLERKENPQNSHIKRDMIEIGLWKWWDPTQDGCFFEVDNIVCVQSAKN